MTSTSPGRTAAVSKTHQSVEGSSGSGATGGLQRRPSGEVARATRAPEWYQRSQSPAGRRLTTGEPAPRRRRPREEETAGWWWWAGLCVAYRCINLTSAGSTLQNHLPSPPSTLLEDLQLLPRPTLPQSMCEKNGQTPPSMPVIAPVGTRNSRQASTDPSPCATGATGPTPTPTPTPP